MKTFKKILFDDLKARGLEHIIPKIKSVRHEKYSGGSSLRVQSLDLFKADRAALWAVIREYEMGTFDGMQDMYVYDSDKPKKERTVKYAFLANDFSETVQSKIDEKLRDEYKVYDDETSQKQMGCWRSQAAHRLLCELEAAL